MSKLREIRRRKGLSQADLSLLTRIGIPQISLMENSHLKPFPSWRKRLAAVLEISEKELFGIGDDNGDNT